MMELTVRLPDEVLERLQSEAKRLNVPLDVVVSEALVNYFDEPTKNEILAGLRRSMEQVLAGDFRPAREVLDEIEREAVDDADNG